MPYTYGNWDMVARLFNGRWATTRQIGELVSSLRRVDYSVVESRREGHRVITQWLDDMSDAPFADGTRFPMSFQAQYISTGDCNVDALFISLCAVLSYRTTNAAKDTTAGVDAGGRTRPGNVELAIDQGLQDNVKRFEELQKQLSGLKCDDAVVWTQSSFERRSNSTWAAP